MRYASSANLFYLLILGLLLQKYYKKYNYTNCKHKKI